MKNQYFLFFCADESLLYLTQEYIRPIKYVFPLFLFNQMLAAFLRNDNNPGLATIAVLRGLVISGILILVLPVACGANSLWLAMPITEVLVMIYVIYSMRKCTHLLPVVEGK